MIRLELKQKWDVPGGAVQLSDIISHRGQQTVARFDAWIGDRYRELELRVGDVGQAGEVAFEVCGIERKTSQTTIATRELAATEAAAAVGEGFDVRLGQRLTLPAGQTLQLTGVGHFGVQLLFKESNGCENFRWFDFGFWRVDGLLLEVEAFDRVAGTARLLVHEEDDVNRLRPAEFGDVVSLAPRDVVRFPDGTTLRLRRAERQCYDAVDWRLLAENGDDISYPYAGSITTAGTPLESSVERTFGLLGRGYLLRLRGMDLEPELALRFSVEAEAMERFALGVPFHLGTMASLEGPGGLRLGYRGSGHGHGTSMGPDGELVPMTSAWADFSVALDGASSGFTVDLMEFDQPVTEQVFGYRFTVSSISDYGAIVRVDSGDSDTASDPSSDEDFLPEAE